MAHRLADGSIQMADGRIVFANSLIQAQDLLEIIPLVTPPPAWPFAGGGGGGGGFGGGGGGGSSFINNNAPGGNGAPGADGAPGAPGAQGPQGTNPGVQGPQGNAGAQGAQGLRGFQGFQGLLGAQGNQGPQGNQGNVGTGTQGAQGFQGVQGIQGPQSSITYVFTSPSTLTTTDNMLIPWLPGRDTTVATGTAQVKTAPTGQNLTIDLRIGVRATGVLAAAFATITITAGNLTGTTTFASTLIDSSHFLAAEITQVGSGVAGTDLTVEVF